MSLTIVICDLNNSTTAADRSLATLRSLCTTLISPRTGHGRYCVRIPQKSASESSTRETRGSKHVTTPLPSCPRRLLGQGCPPSLSCAWPSVQDGIDHGGSFHCLRFRHCSPDYSYAQPRGARPVKARDYAPTLKLSLPSVKLLRPRGRFA